MEWYVLVRGVRRWKSIGEMGDLRGATKVQDRRRGRSVVAIVAADCR